ncbi:MAG: hypothetical protein ABI777_08030, partial [Betaproteobacteria bacterium]
MGATGGGGVEMLGGGGAAMLGGGGVGGGGAAMLSGGGAEMLGGAGVIAARMSDLGACASTRATDDFSGAAVAGAGVERSA